MKTTITTILGALAISLTVNAAPRAVLTEEQAKSIAIIQVRALNVKDDVLTVVREGLEPVYSVSSIQHTVGLNVYQIDVRSMRPGQTCQQSIVIDDSSGSIAEEQSATCE